MRGTIELTGRASGEPGLHAKTMTKILAAAEVSARIDHDSVHFQGEMEHVLAAIAVICRLHSAAGLPIDVRVRWQSDNVSRWVLRPPAKGRLRRECDNPKAETVN